ncbi:hypothetical protein B0H17DRAFT_1217309 [Mycena rosella]|uniref:Cyanovirin-N domain-containing protein n=1 Tax=Mycena rosella TaxID=1033263 RepID=A0AAD7BYH5_MYCRO|nr:hypothetical protein B0H17DRAFT_1217309 [Mycena rosella]
MQFAFLQLFLLHQDRDHLLDFQLDLRTQLLGGAHPRHSDRNEHHSTSTPGANPITLVNFSHTCDGIAFSGTILKASCRNWNGDFKTTSIDTNGCVGNALAAFFCPTSTGNKQALPASLDLDFVISNSNGALICP